ncbi:MAG: glucose-1-phosphate adenylyltransferase subunit GlgD [bacterium]|nr:glucose-1-phosphate adenylyltransferase subunit GlgD [bacterium]
MLLAGGQGSRLNILASHRAKPAVPFAGSYRIIDATLSNVMNSDIENVGVLTQYRPGSLINHIKTGESWDLYGKNRGAMILPPFKGKGDSSWYQGTADAIYQNFSYFNRFDDIERVLILSGDHIYTMNYKELVHYHREKNADVTVVAMQVPFEEASRFGTIITDDANKIIGFEEKPKNPKTNLISLGIYLFNKATLMEELKKDALDENSSHDFGRDILPKLLNKNIYIYQFTGYWKDVGTIEEYWQTNMELLNNNNKLDLEKWRVTTNLQTNKIADRNPAYISHSACVKKSFISDGCVIKGEVRNSVLSPGVIVEKDALIEDSIIFDDTIIKKGVKVNKAIIDKNVEILEEAIIGTGDLPGIGNRIYPHHLYTGITIIGKNAIVGRKVEIGRNCIVSPDAYVEKKRYNTGEMVF